MGILSKSGSPAATSIYAALYENFSDGVVWLSIDGLPPRCVVKITNIESGHSVFCQALQFDANFLRRYNNGPGTRCIESPESSIVMSYWYRAKLGGCKALETGPNHTLQIKAAKPWTRWWWGIRACMHHPQLAIRVAVWLATVSIISSAVLSCAPHTYGSFGSRKLISTVARTGTAWPSFVAG